jgi:hypothetical protein
MKALDYAIDTVDEETFADLAAAFIRSRGYRTKEGIERGEWGARVWMRARPGIACASVAPDWRAELRASARKVKRLERDGNTAYELFVFVTNQDVTGLQEFEIEDEIRREYGWRLKLYHRQDLLGEIYNTTPGLAKHHLDVNLGFETGHLATLEELRDERLDAIEERRGETTDLRQGPTVVLHVIPNGIFSTEKRRVSSELPDPCLLSGRDSPALDARSELKIAYDHPDESEYTEYALLRTDGLYEAVTTALFERVEGELLLAGGDCSPTLDASVIVAVREVLSQLGTLGFSATASVWITILGATDARLDSGTREEKRSSSLGFEQYTTKVATASIGVCETASVVSDLESILSELWRTFGYPDGTPHIEDGEWTSGAVTVEDLRFS